MPSIGGQGLAHCGTQAGTIERREDTLSCPALHSFGIPNALRFILFYSMEERVHDLDCTWIFYGLLILEHSDICSEIFMDFANIKSADMNM